MNSVFWNWNIASMKRGIEAGTLGLILQSVQLKSGLYFNMSNLFTKIYNMLYYTTNLYLQ